jgi:hypothetical protein
MKRLVLLTLMACLCGLVAPRPETARAAEAMCTCLSPKRPACEVWWQTSAIFLGRVTRIDVVREEVDGQTRVKRLVTMRVQERWRGLQGMREVVVATGAGGGDCGFQFDENETYLVYANQSVETGRYETGICSRTAKQSEAGVDLAFLRGLETAPQTVSLYGMIYRERQSLIGGLDPDRQLDPGGPLAGVEIQLTDPVGKTHTMTSDADGWYEIDGLPAGRYELSLAGEGIDDESRWRMRIPTAPACIWRNIIVKPLPVDSGSLPERSG